MQTLDVISVNLWQILISLANLFLLFLILKRFLFKPVKNVLDKRQSELDESYAAAKEAEEQAEVHRASYESKLAEANARADAILEDAASTAKTRGEKIVAEAKERADGILRTAEMEAELERMLLARGIGELTAVYVPTAKNAPAGNLFSSFGFETVRQEQGRTEYRLLLAGRKPLKWAGTLKGERI